MKILMIVLVLAGAFFVFAPHEVHLSLGLTFDHVYHVLTGVVLWAVSGFLFFKSKKK